MKFFMFELFTGPLHGIDLRSSAALPSPALDLSRLKHKDILGGTTVKKINEVPWQV
jgi:hypothetical protein